MNGHLFPTVFPASIHRSPGVSLDILHEFPDLLDRRLQIDRRL